MDPDSDEWEPRNEWMSTYSTGPDQPDPNHLQLDIRPDPDLSHSWTWIHISMNPMWFKWDSFNFVRQACHISTINCESESIYENKWIRIQMNESHAMSGWAHIRQVLTKQIQTINTSISAGPGSKSQLDLNPYQHEPDVVQMGLI